MSHLRFVYACTLASLLLAMTACSSSNIPTYPITGKVTKAGKPIAGATVFFFPQGGTKQFQELVPPRGTTRSDGTFSLETFGENDGAPAGAYKVTITWNEAPAHQRTKKNIHAFADDDPEAEQEVGSDSPDKLRGQYGDPSTTPLMATIPAAPAELPAFELP